MMSGETLLILGHVVKGKGQLWNSVYKVLLAQYRLQFMSNHFQTSHVDDEGRNPIDFGSRGHRSRSTLPPCEGMPRFVLSIVIVSHRRSANSCVRLSHVDLLDTVQTNLLWEYLSKFRRYVNHDEMVNPIDVEVKRSMDKYGQTSPY